MDIANNYKKIFEYVKSIAPDACIMSVTKQRSENDILQLSEAGADIFGENRVDEVYQKYVVNGLRKKLPEKTKIYMIGNLQSRKVRKALELFDCIMSVSSLSLAQEIDKRAQQLGKIMDICLEINISEEPQKIGFNLSEIYSAFEQIIAMKNINVIGLMCMTPYLAEEAELHKIFSTAADIRNKLQDKFRKILPILSMGMSQDYKIALQHGSNMLRIGSLLFE